MKKRNAISWIAGAALLTCGTAVQAIEGSKKVPAGSGGKLVLDLDAGGKVRISGTGGSAVEVVYSGACSPPCEVNVEESGGAVRVTNGFEKRGRSSNSDLEFDIKVPARFDIEIESMGGGLSIDDVDGTFTGKTMGGELTLKNVRGEAKLTTMGGEIRLNDSELDGFLKTMGGEVTFENVVGDVRGTSMGGNVRYKNVKSRGGRSASPDHIKASGGDVDPDTVQISTQGGEVEVEEAPEGAELFTMGGDISVNDARKFVRAKTMGGDVKINSVDGSVDATTMGGNIDVHVTGSGGDVELTSMAGDIDLAIPAGFGMDLDIELAFTRNSEKNYKITAPGGLKATVTPEWDHSQGTPRKYIRMMGAVNGGGQKVKIRTTNGNVDLNEGR